MAKRRGAVTNNGCLVNQKMVQSEHDHCPQKWTSATQRHLDCRRVDVDACRAMILRASLVFPLGRPLVDTIGRSRTGACRGLFQSRAVSKINLVIGSNSRFRSPHPSGMSVRKIGRVDSKINDSPLTSKLCALTGLRLCVCEAQLTLYFMKLM